MSYAAVSFLDDQGAVFAGRAFFGLNTHLMAVNASDSGWTAASEEPSLTRAHRSRAAPRRDS